jgi:hypothetical protein
MTTHKLHIVLAAILALAAMSSAAGAANPRHGVVPTYYYGGGFVW